MSLKESITKIENSILLKKRLIKSLNEERKGLEKSIQILKGSRRFSGDISKLISHLIFYQGGLVISLPDEISAALDFIAFIIKIEKEVEIFKKTGDVDLFATIIKLLKEEEHRKIDCKTVEEEIQKVTENLQNLNLQIKKEENELIMLKMELNSLESKRPIIEDSPFTKAFKEAGLTK